MTAKDWIEAIGIGVAVLLSVLSFFPGLRKTLAETRTSTSAARSSDAETYESMADTVGNLTRQLKDALADIDAVRQSLVLEREERIKLQRQLAVTQEQLALNLAQMAAMQRELSEAQTAVAQLEGALVEEQEARRAIEQDMIQMTARVRALEKENVLLKEENASLRDTLSAYQEDMYHE